MRFGEIVKKRERKQENDGREENERNSLKYGSKETREADSAVKYNHHLSSIFKYDFNLFKHNFFQGKRAKVVDEDVPQVMV